MSTKPIAGALLPSGTGAEIQPALIDGLDSIQRLVGGNIDVVRVRLEDELLVGYCHDEGLILDLDMNWYASALFERELRGPVVVVSAKAPSGVVDGDDYDLPSTVFGFLTTVFTENVKESFGMTVMFTMGVKLAVKMGVMSEEDVRNMHAEMERHQEENTDSEEVKAFMEELMKKINEAAVLYESPSMVSEIEEFLKQQ